MDPETQADPEVAAPAAAPEPAPEAAPEPSQEDPIQEELDRIESKGRSKEDKLLFTYKRVKKQLSEAGIDPDAAAPSDEDRPLTIRDFAAIRAIEAQETAISLADTEIADENERKLVKHHLENTIKPSGDAQTDLRNAQALVNAVKNRQLAEESGRAARARTAPSAPSAPPRQAGAEVELTPEQAKVMKGFGLTKEEAVEALKG